MVMEELVVPRPVDVPSWAVAAVELLAAVVAVVVAAVDGVVVAVAVEHEHLDGGGEVGDGKIGAVGILEGEGGDTGGDGQIVDISPGEGVAAQHDHDLQHLKRVHHSTKGVRVLVYSSIYLSFNESEADKQNDLYL